MSEWQPIETAPKDGTKLLLCESVDENYIFVGSWSETRNPKWYGTNWYCVEYDAFNHAPTHWMPLPQPPEKTE